MAKSAAASRTTKRAKEEIGKRAVAAASKKRKQVGLFALCSLDVSLTI
jgi:hypothetical protein